MTGRIARIVVWALGTVLALSGLSFAATGGLGSPTTEEPENTSAPLEVNEPVVVSAQEPESGELEEQENDEGPPPGVGPAWSTEGRPEGFTGNHGQYVSSVEDTDEARSAAARSQCGKPAHAGPGKGNGTARADEASGGRSGQGADNAERRGPPEGKGPGQGDDAE